MHTLKVSYHCSSDLIIKLNKKEQNERGDIVDMKCMGINSPEMLFLGNSDAVIFKIAIGNVFNI